MQNFRVTNKEHYGMLWYFLEWSIVDFFPLCFWVTDCGKVLTLKKVQLMASGEFNAESSSQNYQKQNNKEEATGKNNKCPWTRAWAVGS